MKSITFIVDVPGWSLDLFANRIASYLSMNVIIHYIYKNVQSIGKSKPNYRLPDTDFYYFTSWWFLYELISLGIKIDGVKLIDVVDNYSWKSSMFDIAKKNADCVFTQSLVYASVDKDVAFHPYPASNDYLSTQICRRVTSNVKIGMIANRSKHSGGDHKGVTFGRYVCNLLGVNLEIAGTDIYIEQSRMKDWYLGLSAFMSLSISEGFSNAIVDALSLDVPVIGTSVSPLVPFVDKKFYCHVDRSNMYSIVKAINKITVEMFSNSARDIVKQWTADRVARIITDKLEICR